MQCIDGSSILLQRYVTKGNDAKKPAFLAFVCYRKNPVKCNACAVAQKIETECFSRNVPFSRDPHTRMSRNFGDYEILIKGSLPGGKEILLYNVVSTSGL